ncbi:shikimate dehydrogenase family protein [Leucobacter coleopterorum]|uniref:shikimate dehydrogenase family protein n=1 Tax=Leucobacter coleopterorum TaxID=2714933 RepID=UPI001FCBB412|nr:shikimate dehydrogenase [Leucobacter coleopterorum]
MTKSEQRQLAVLGSPIAHSKSPLIHRAAYELLELPWDYGSAELTADGLEAFLKSCGAEWQGLSLTMPLKEEAHRLAVMRDPVAEQSGVVNTLLRLAGDAGWAGFNTDVPGLASAIDRADLDVTHTIVLGSGATAVSAILAVQHLGAERVQILARNTATAADLAQRFNLEPGGNAAATLVISTLPGPASDTVELPSELLQIPLFDVAYDPWPSPLARRWEAAGGVSHSGLEMLVEQAIIQIRIFRNGDPDTPLPSEDEVRAAMQRAVHSD